MGLWSRFKPRLPRLRGPGKKMYRARVKAEGKDPHVVVWLDVGHEDGPVLLTNERQVTIPASSSFAKVETQAVNFRGNTIPLIELAPVATVDEPTPEIVAVPEEFQGVPLPVVDRRDELAE